MLANDLTQRLGISVPIVSAPMAGMAGGRLVAAVSSAGGLGMIGVGGAATAEQIKHEAAIAAAGGPYGIGLTAWILDTRPEQLDAALAASPALVSVSFGDYRPWVARLREAGITTATQVGDLDEALVAEDAGVDVLVVRGAEGGGHGMDSVATLPLLQQVLDRVLEVPVVAAGGIGTGRGLAAVLAAGAAGAWIGTAYLGCPETAGSPRARQRVIEAEETVYSRVFDVAQGLGWPERYGGRSLANRFTDRWAGQEAELADDPAAQRELAEARAVEDFDTAHIYAGQGVGLVTEQRPAADVTTAIADQAASLLSAGAPGKGP